MTSDSQSVLQAQKHELAVHVRASVGLVVIESRTHDNGLNCR